MDNTKNQIKTGAVLSYAQLAISILIGLLYTPFMVRTLGKSEYGLYNTVMSVVSMISIISLGFQSGYIRYFTEYKTRNDEDAIARLNGLFIIVFMFMGFVTLILGMFITKNLEAVFGTGLTPSEYEIAEKLMLILTLNLAISLPTSVFSNIISANERFVALKAILLIKTVLTPAVSVCLLLLGYKSIALALATVTVSILIDIAYYIYSKIALKSRFVFVDLDGGLIKAIFVYTGFVAVQIIADQVNCNLDKFIIGRIRGTEEVAVYSVGQTLFSYYQIIGFACVSFFAPRVHRIVEQHRNESSILRNKLTEVFCMVGRLQFPIIAIIVTGFAFFGKEFIYYWVGPGYEYSYIIALILMISGFFDLVQNLGIEIQRAQDKHKFRAIVYLIMAAINIVISVILCKSYGAIGSTVGTAISFIVCQGLVVNWYYNKECNIDIKVFWISILKMCRGLILPIAFGVALKLFVKCDSIIILALCILAYCLVYIISMYIWGINSGEKQLIKMQLSRLKTKK